MAEMPMWKFDNIKQRIAQPKNDFREEYFDVCDNTDKYVIPERFTCKYLIKRHEDPDNCDKYIKQYDGLINQIRGEIKKREAKVVHITDVYK